MTSESHQGQLALLTKKFAKYYAHLVGEIDSLDKKNSFRDRDNWMLKYQKLKDEVISSMTEIENNFPKQKYIG